MKSRILILALSHGSSSLKLFNSTSQLPANMTSECKDALTADISCSPRLITPSDALARLEHNTTILSDYCSDTCTESLAGWSSNITTCCGNTTFDFGFSALLGGQPVLRAAPDLASSLLWARNLTCLRDRNASSHDFCAPSLSNGTFPECADCTLQYLATLLSSWYGVARAPSPAAFDGLLDKCCVDKTLYPVQNWTAPQLPPPPERPNITCFGGCLYTVEEGDTCESIAREQGVAYDRFVYQNGLDWDCRGGLTVGREMCVGSACALYTVQENDSCASVLAEHKNFTLTELVAWNPAIHRSCDNLGWLKGRDICVSPPGAESYDVNTTVDWSAGWTSPTWGQWIAVPTAGTPWNDTASTSAPPAPAITAALNATAELLHARLVEEHCPITREDWDRGFEWMHLSAECRRMLRPYCSPHLETAVPPRPEGGFPAACLPASAMGW